MSTLRKTVDPKVKPLNPTFKSPENIYFGITPTSWWNDDFQDIDANIPFEQCVSEMALAGYVGCSMGHKYPTDLDVLKDKLALRGLRVSEPWTSLFFTVEGKFEQTIEDFKKSLEIIKKLGGQDMVVAEFGNSLHLNPVSYFRKHPEFTEVQWQRLTKGLDIIGEIAAESGMRLCYHHHIGTGVQTRAQIDRLMENTNPKYVHLLFDCGHLYIAGDDPLSLAKDHMHRIKHAHLKNVRIGVLEEAIKNQLSFKDAIKAGIFTVPGDVEAQLCIDFTAILQVFADNNFEGWLIVEAEQDPNKAYPLTYALLGRDCLRVITGF